MPSARADCLRPLQPEIPASHASDSDFKHVRIAVASYLKALDTYSVCLKNEAASLKPLDALAAYREADRAFDLMQQEVDSYDAALAARGAGS